MREALTRLSDREDPVSDAVWGEADKQFDEPELAALILAIASITGTGSTSPCASRAGVWKG